MDYTNKVLGLRTQTQIPLNVKEYVESEEALKDLGPGNNLAFVYEKGLVVYCILEGTRYEWKEVPSGEENTGLLDNDFIYPDNIITFGIDYSNKSYNFFTTEIVFEIPPLQEVLNVGKYAEVDEGFSYVDILGGSNDNRNFNAFISKSDGTYASLIGIGSNYAGISGGNNSGSSPIPIDERRSGGLYINEADDNHLIIQQRYGLNASNLKFTDPIANKLSGGANFYIPAKILGDYIIATLDDIPTIDGSETKINSGITTTKTGLGTIVSPYTIEVNNNQKILTYPGDFTGVNYTLTNSDFDTLIFVNNGATNVTITVPTGLVDKFYSVFIRQGSGEVSFISSGTTINTAVGLKISLQNDHVCLDKVGTTTVFHLTGNTKI